MRLQRTLLLLVACAAAAPASLVVGLLARGHAQLDAASVATSAGALVVAAVLSALVARSVTRPIAECVRGALEIARGRFGREVAVRAHNEIGDLALGFNHMSRELARYDAENRRLIHDLEAGYLDTLRSLASAIDAKDPYTRGHSERVAELAAEIGRELGLPRETVAALVYGGILHDIGKIGVPDAILAKRSPLTPEERALVEVHPVTGAEIVAGVEFLRSAVPAIRGHHERWDGDGYPDRLRGEEIPLVARIVNAADTWDACTTTRPYQSGLAEGDALPLLAELRGTQIDPAVHDALVAVLRRRAAAARAPSAA
ncbi:MULTISPECIES: HD-GYP domain-containing protein [unclassified Anaeromyxobacter]|uniref:HD-GYP domain-containing protein n=1 Tax=unclassified Anaeromyxobacter TaxID=2620896 RepID=UPI001F565978|nr:MULTISPECIES: HD-GYP domain-containing protein [unclassified Anaeromyxobacter]